MNAGKIIKYYREQAQLTQGQLGEGICSDTHISKIERGITEYSDEITFLLANRLHINLEEEHERFTELKKLLFRWEDSMIRQHHYEMERIKNTLDQEQDIIIFEYYVFYNLLLARYYLIKYDTEKAYKIIKNIQKKYNKLAPFESNLLLHIIGIYYIDTNAFDKALQSLSVINQDDYDNLEFYFHLSISYHATHSLQKAHYYAEKVLEYFTKTKNYLSVIDTEMILLMTGVIEEKRAFQEIVSQYETLLINCDLFNVPDKKAKLLHNLSIEYYERKEYKKSIHYLQQSMDLLDKFSKVYLQSLELFIRVSLEGNLMSKRELLLVANEGFKKAGTLNSELFVILFSLLIHILSNEIELYFTYLHETALPFFQLNGYVSLQKKFYKDLFNLYKKNNQTEKALEIANRLINQL